MASQWDDVSFVIASTYRTAVLERLVRGPATPSMIGADTEIEIAHISRALRELRERSFVELLVSDDRRKGRVYGITEYGNDTWTTIEAQHLA